MRIDLSSKDVIALLIAQITPYLQGKSVCYAVEKCEGLTSIKRTIDWTIDWTADWIWWSKRVRINDFAYFRKEFAVRDSLVSAQLYVSAHNTAHVYVNGTKVGGYGSPAPTNPWKRKYYLTYEITEHLNDGLNCLTADAHYLGGSGQNFVNGLPGFRLELHLTYADGSKKIVKTDGTWEALKEIPHRIGAPYQQNRRVSAIEDYDARKWDPKWRYIGWKDASNTIKAKKARIGRDEWNMMEQQIPEGAIEEEIRLTKLSALAVEGELSFAQVFDVGRIVSGWPKLSLKGFEGATVRLRYSEDLDENGRVKHNVTNEHSDNYYDEYTMRGDELESWQPDFSYKAFRYVEVTGYPLPIENGNEVNVCLAYTAIPYVGSFNCSDESLNDLYEACIRTQKNNTLGQTVDCPHREQAQYTADTDLQAESLLYNFDAISVVEKTLSDFTDAQLEDGTFPFVTPTNYEHPDFNLQIPEWDLHYATLLWKLYQASGNVKLLDNSYETARRMVDYFIGKLDPVTGLVPLDKGWHISDWPYPSVDHQGEFLTVQQVKLIQAMQIVSQAAELIGKQDDYKLYREHAAWLSDNLVKHLYDGELKRFKDSSESTKTHQGVTAIALYADLVPTADREAAVAYVASKQFECRTVLSLPLLRMLFENGRGDEAYELLSRKEYPGWGYMIAQGARTMWEGWEDMESHSHAWNGYPARLLQEYVVGIKSEAPGFAKAVIRPYLPEGLAYAEAEVWTPLGTVYAGWERVAGGSVRVRARIPAGMSARLELKLASGSVKQELNFGENEVTLN
ncbi:alpha-L-rhamnosidase [Cohnella abietis]|uniref:alpha-L-rhamnosidase n=1 Tax=Cohnella abietis TaxID=2507935 RepID=A0A3T1DAR1_9BACL|nr:alpha-L-rhamnosidase [Cohnella abietis]BBI35192.1 alpha-rhamnosidase [Cohnella abietis]